MTWFRDEGNYVELVAMDSYLIPLSRITEGSQ